jgi:hypothetical protein
LVIDIAVAVLVILALILGYQRGVIQPLMAEIFFFGTLLVIFRFHDAYTAEMEKIAHINAVLSIFIAIVIALILGGVGGAIGGAFHRLEAIRGVDGLLGVFVHVIVTLVLIYLAMVSKDDLTALKAAAAKNNAAHIDAIAGIHQLEQLYTGFLQPQLHSSRTVPFILSIGDKLPIIGHVGPNDLKPVPTPTACPSASPSPSPTKSPAKASPSPKVTPTPKPSAQPC